MITAYGNRSYTSLRRFICLSYSLCFHHPNIKKRIDRVISIACAMAYDKMMMKE